MYGLTNAQLRTKVSITYLYFLKYVGTYMLTDIWVWPESWYQTIRVSPPVLNFTTCIFQG